MFRVSGIITSLMIQTLNELHLKQYVLAIVLYMCALAYKVSVISHKQHISVNRQLLLVSYIT